MTPSPGGERSEIVAPTREDPLAAAMSERIGGPAGEHARPHWWWTPLRVLLMVFAVVFALGLVQKAPCVNSHWTDNDTRYGAMCYSDVPYLYTGRGFAEQTWPYSDTHGRYDVMEYPVGISYFAWAASKIVAISPDGPPQAQRAATKPAELWSLVGMPDEVNQYFFVTALMLCLFGLAATWLLAGAHRRRPWDALPFVLSPCLLFTGLVNWDLLAVAFTAGALWSWSRGKPLWAGVFIGLGTATKLYPLFLLGALLVVAVRRQRLSWFAWATGGAAVAWLLANLPAMLTGLAQWKVFWKFNSGRGPDLGSVWFFLSQRHVDVSTHAVNVASWVFFAGACLAILVLGLRAPKTPRVAQLAFLIVAAFLAVNKVYSPQYVLWLLPLAVLARPRWRDLLIWQACEMAYFGAVWLYLGGWLAAASSTGGSPAYLLAIVIRLAGEIYLIALVVRDIWLPEYDPVRAHGPVDELGDDPMTPLPSGPPTRRTGAESQRTGG